MNRREVLLSAVGVGVFGAIRTTKAAAKSPSGTWDKPVEFLCLAYQQLSPERTMLRGVGWKAEYHGKEYGEIVQMSPIYTLAEMAVALALVSDRAAEQLAFLVENQSA